MIEASKLCLSYTNKPLVEDVSFHMERGEIFGFLGLSGAGKSATQKVLTGFNTRYERSAKIAGTEICKKANRFYERIGVDFGFPTCYEKFTTRENLKYFGSLYDWPLRSTEKLLRIMGLENDGDKKISDFPKGTRSRLNFIKTLVRSPDILLFGGPTSGLDPINSRLMKDIILTEKKRGETIIITTYNMFNVTKPCDQVAFIVLEKVSALGTPYNFIMSRGVVETRYAYFESGEKTSECMLI